MDGSVIENVCLWVPCLAYPSLQEVPVWYTRRLLIFCFVYSSCYCVGYYYSANHTFNLMEYKSFSLYELYFLSSVDEKIKLLLFN